MNKPDKNLVQNCPSIYSNSAGILLLALVICQSAVFPQRLSRDLNVDLLVNQVGYLPESFKICTTRGTASRTFEVIDILTLKVAYSGTLKPATGDLGEYLTGDFSELTYEGYYYIKSDTLRSYPFRIMKDIYLEPAQSILEYFSKQRCGASTTGYLSPCHLDDGIRLDNGKHWDVTGGWHDASDLRKWVSATIYGMIGLGRVYELSECSRRDKILEELKWGNQYFLKMQDTSGYIMNFIGGDVKKHGDSNRWTDNIIMSQGKELHLVRPNADSSTSLMTVYDKNDDRIIQTEPADIITQLQFVTAEALMSRIIADIGPKYSTRCLEAALKCFNWCSNTLAQYEMTPGVLGAAIQAAIEMYKATNNDKYRKFAVEMASQLELLQVDETNTKPYGFFKTSINNDAPYKQILGSLELLAICDLYLTFPEDKNADVWKRIIEKYVYEYLLPITGKNSFSLVPYGLYEVADPGGGRKTGKYWYRYFMEPNPDWWVGINSNLATTGIGLIKASGVLKDKGLILLAQKQLDWVLGVNPFNSSTLTGWGYNHPEKYETSSFIPGVPVIQGAVMNGLGGDGFDQPFIGTGDWQVSEYWTPMAANTLWLLVQLNYNKHN